MMLVVLIGSNIYYLYFVLPRLINDIVFRVPNDNLYKLVDRVSVFKKYDMQILINDMLIFDSIIGTMAQNSVYMSSNFDSTALLKESSTNDVSQVDNREDITSIYIRPKDVVSSSLSDYYQYDEDLPWCKFIATFFANYDMENLQDMSKASIYLGFTQSELFCQYPNLRPSYFFEENDLTDGKCPSYSYDIDTKKCFYLQRIRSWHLNAKTDYGYTFLNSLYTFSSTGEYGNTISLTIRDNDDRILGVLGIDFKPLIANSEFIGSNLLSRRDQLESRFEYFLLDPTLLNDTYVRTDTFLYGDSEWDFEEISNLLQTLVYTGDDKESIQNSMTNETFKNIKGQEVFYAKFEVKNVQDTEDVKDVEGGDRLMFFNPWYLKMRPRDDRIKTVVGDVFVLISTSRFLEDEQTNIQESIFYSAIIIALIFLTFIFIFGFMFTNWVANKYSGVITKPI